MRSKVDSCSLPNALQGHSKAYRLQPGILFPMRSAMALLLSFRSPLRVLAPTTAVLSFDPFPCPTRTRWSTWSWSTFHRNVTCQPSQVIVRWRATVPFLVLRRFTSSRLGRHRITLPTCKRRVSDKCLILKRFRIFGMVYVL